MNSIGERIKYLRKQKGITQVQLADMIDVSKQLLYKYENGIVTNIPSDKIELISQKLGTSPAYLMGWDDDRAAKEKAYNELIQELQLNDSQIEQVLNYARYIKSLED